MRVVSLSESLLMSKPLEAALKEGTVETIEIPREESVDELYEKINLLKAEIASMLSN